MGSSFVFLENFNRSLIRTELTRHKVPQAHWSQVWLILCSVLVVSRYKKNHKRTFTFLNSLYLSISALPATRCSPDSPSVPRVYFPPLISSLSVPFCAHLPFFRPRPLSLARPPFSTSSSFSLRIAVPSSRSAADWQSYKLIFLAHCVLPASPLFSCGHSRV